MIKSRKLQPPSSGTLRRRLLFFLPIAAAYIAAAELGFMLSGATKQVTAVWPPSGIALALVLLCGYRVWPGLALGAFLVNYSTHEPFLTACAIAAGNTLEAVLGAFLLRELAGFQNSFEHLRDVFSLTVFAALMSTTVSATIGVASLCLGGVPGATWGNYGATWRVWWVGDAMGVLIVAPLILTCASKPYIPRAGSRVFEAAAVFVLLIITSVLVLANRVGIESLDYQQKYIVFPFLVWVAFRYGQRATTVALALVLAVATWAVIQERGPFLTGTQDDRLLLMQAFMAVLSVTALAMGVAVAERKKAEEALRESEENYRAMFELAGIGKAQVDVKTGCFLRVNRKLCEIIGYSNEDLLKKSFLEVTHPEDRQRDFADFQRMVCGELSEKVIEKRYIHKDGRIVWVRVTATVSRGAKGRPGRCAAVIEDITERKRSEAERAELLRREQEARSHAESANRAKDEFLATVSHELRTPLTAILGWARLISGGKLNSEKQARGLEIIKNSAQVQTKLIDDLLDVSRIIAGKLRIEIQPVEIASIMEAAVDAVRLAAKVKNIEIDFVSEPLDRPVLGDPNRLQQIFWNLLSNAIKFTPAGGRVTVRVESTQSHAKISVSDTGIGIKPEFLPRMFERFRQSDSTITRQFTGLGLGLAIVRHLVELHGGEVTAASSGEGKGATMTVLLPMATPVAPASPAKSSGVLSSTRIFECPAAAGLHVLFVDDEFNTREMIRAVLEECRVKVTTAGSVAEALELLDALHPDVLISDIAMPGEDGYMLLRKVRARGCRLPAAAMTAFANNEGRIRAYGEGFQIYIAKPVEPRELIEAVAKLAELAQSGNRSVVPASPMGNGESGEQR